MATPPGQTATMLVALLPRAAVGGVFVAALAVLLGGWLFGFDALKTLDPDLAAMVPSTAVCFLALCGAILMQLRAPDGSASAAPWPGALAALVALIALADLAVIYLGLAPGIDSLVWPRVIGASGAAMAPATAISCLIAAACVVTIRRPGNLYVACSSAGLLIASVVIIGYLFDVHALYAVPLFTAMALHTSLGFFAVFGALILARPDHGWIPVLLGPGQGSAGARRLMPVVVLLPLALCYLALLATGLDLFNANFRLSVIAIAMIALLLATVLRNAVIENDVERRLIATIADRELLLAEVYHRVKNNLQQVDALIHIHRAKITDPVALDTLDSLSHRVRALAHAHNLLVSAGSPSQLGVVTFLRELCASIAQLHGVADRGISLVVDGDDAAVSVEQAISLGLIANELITNALKHAFAGRDGGAIAVRYRAVPDGGGELVISDDGVGLAGDADAIPDGGTGARIIAGLVRQLRAAMKVDAGAGTSITIAVPGSTGGR